MKILRQFIHILVILSTLVLNAQVATVNTETKVLKTIEGNESSKTYLVYLQDSLNGGKYNFEVWDRKLTHNVKNKTYTLNWIRNKNSKKESYNYEIIFDTNFKTLTERVIHKKLKDDHYITNRKYFMYENNKMYSSPDSLLHNTLPVRIDDLKYAINWELDLETVEALPLRLHKEFAICFYHPGSKTLPKYYNLIVDRSEIVELNEKNFDCWVLKVAYSKHQTCEFWVDKKTNTVLVTKDKVFGKYRFKRLVV